MLGHNYRGKYSKACFWERVSFKSQFTSLSNSPQNMELFLFVFGAGRGRERCEMMVKIEGINRAGHS
jgi:hypothetical protein